MKLFDSLSEKNQKMLLESDYPTIKENLINSLKEKEYIIELTMLEANDIHAFLNLGVFEINKLYNVFNR